MVALGRRSVAVLLVPVALGVGPACGSDGASDGDGDAASGGNAGDTGRAGAGVGGARAGAGGTSGSSSQGGSSGRGNEGGGAAAGRAGAANAGQGGDSGGSGGESGATASGEGGAGGDGGSTPVGDCAAIPTFEDGKSPSQELHVAVDGDDAAGDGSAANPFATIERAAREAAPGTAIRVHAGTYGGDNYVEGLAGTEAAPIWIGGAPGEERPVLEGGAQALHLVRARWVVVHDLEVREQSANGINADDGGDRDDAMAARGLIFRNLSIHDVGSGGNQDCLKLSGINAYFVLDSEFARCGGGGSGSAIDHVGCHDGLIARNEFRELSGGNAVQNKGGSRNVEIRWNRMVSAGQRAVNLGGSTGFEFFRPPLSASEDNAEARDIRVIANVIEGGVAALAFVGCVDCLAANNTIVDPENWVLRILQETRSNDDYAFLPASRGRFVNNLVYFDRGELSTTINVGDQTDPESFVFRNNLWYAHDRPSQSRPTDLPADESDGIYGEDPGLADPAAGDFSITSASPANGAGTPLAELTGDINGNCYADPPSIGAFEAPR